MIKDLSLSLMSPILRFVAAKQYLCCIRISSRTIKAVFFWELAKIDCFGMLHLLSLLISIGILNLICEILPPGRNNAAKPKEGMKKTFFSAQKLLQSIVYRNIFLVPTEPLGKKCAVAGSN